MNRIKTRPDDSRLHRANIGLRGCDLAVLDRRVAQARVAGDRGANRSSEVRRALNESRRLRHDLASPLQAMRLTVDGLARGRFRPGEAARLLAECVRDLEAAATDAPASSYASG